MGSRDGLIEPTANDANAAQRTEEEEEEAGEVRERGIPYAEAHCGGVTNRKPRDGGSDPKQQYSHSEQKMRRSGTEKRPSS